MHTFTYPHSRGIHFVFDLSFFLSFLLSFCLSFCRGKVGYCQSLPSDVVLFGASYGVYWGVQSLQDIQDGVKLI